MHVTTKNLGGMLMHLQGIALSNCSFKAAIIDGKFAKETLASDCNLNEDLIGQ